ncbi:Pol1 [Kluyveromyces lactis]|nr:Pol1 [Kluyveromyces lactis]
MSNANKLELLKKLQKARNNKSNRDVLDEQLEEENVYDLIDEDQYRSKKRQELLRDDFVEDDDGSGYVDRGVDEWDQSQEFYSDEDDGVDAKSGKKHNRTGKNNKSKDTISDIIKQQNVKRKMTVPTEKPKKVSLAEFDDILSEFDAEPLVKKPKLTISRKQPENTTPMNYKHPQIDTSPLRGKDVVHFKADSVNPLDSDSIEEDHDIESLLNDVASSPSMSKQKTYQSEDESEDDEDDIHFGRKKFKSIAAQRQMNISAQTAPLTSSPTYVTAPNTPLSTSTGSTQVTEAISGSLRQRIPKEDVVDAETDSFNFFWTDFTEVNSSLILFGKVKTKKNEVVSAMAQINGFNRELYFLPKEGKTASDVHQEIVPLLLDKYGLQSLRAKPETKKYAFELPGIPHEAEYLKVLLPYDTPKCKSITIPAELEGDTFGHVFGGNQNLFESFVVQRKIMGPCWLKISDGNFDSVQGASHCAIEVQIDSPNRISATNEKSSPSLNCISLSIQTVMNAKENKQEIVAISMAVFKNLSQDSSIPQNLRPNEIVTLVRPPQGSTFPPLLAPKSKKELSGNVRLFNNEKTLLNCFCALLKVNDPDVIIGHRLEGVILDVLAHRAYELNIPQFSVFGRRLRKAWPDKFGKHNNSMTQFIVRDLFAGRLLCDISNEMGQSLTPKCQNWELNEMYQVSCGIERKSLEINYLNPIYQEDESQMLLALGENIENSIITAEVAFRIQILSLTKQLTNLAGNGWRQTLGGTRAGRNEYILLHEFNRNDYIVPDKETRQMKQDRQQKNEDPMEPQVSSKKSKYQGGLVFEPEKGLHKNYILVMDFNSLYPSIIQEFNICFTTVDRNPQDIEELPDVPSREKSQGVLPRLLANLVQRRREVKNLMKTENDASKKAQYDIRQQALKLTANSMYGCLGYVNSRFYAKPLAMLVTNKGREILMNTRQLAESLGLTVVYGDTDSVMISTGCDNYMDAIKIGENFKKLVNERYSLLEIDIDNIFKRLLLHAKKKYAALNVTFDKQNNEKTTLEVKGLDMKRREFCPLSKEVSTRVLNILLSDKDSESALQEIYAYMEEIRQKVENNEIRMDKYKINTRLSKDPKSYPGGKNMPAVQVALRMREAGRVVKAGSVITFVITKGSDDSDQDSDQANVAERARALNEVMNKKNGLKPDPVYYLGKQIFSPVQRLLERIESFDIIRLSEALGLDSRKYINRGGANGELNGRGMDTLQPLETTISDEERFRDSVPLELTCPNCDTKFVYGGIVASKEYRFVYSGIQCSNCNHIMTPIQVTSQLERIIRAHISLYYAGWVACDDSTCGNVTRQISVFGKRCLLDGCTGVMSYKYSDKQLYNQMLYFQSLFDLQKNKLQTLKPLYHSGDSNAPEKSLSHSEVQALAEQNRLLFEVSKQVVEKYLSDCGRAYVNMGSIFDFMLSQ